MRVNADRLPGAASAGDGAAEGRAPQADAIAMVERRASVVRGDIDAPGGMRNRRFETCRFVVRRARRDATLFAIG